MKFTSLILISLLTTTAYGEIKTGPYGTYEWTDGAQYNWSSGGNHPDRMNVSLKTENGEDVIYLHADQTYGINRQDYVINLAQKTLDLKYQVGGYLSGSAQFQLEVSSFRPDSKAILKDVQANLRKIAEGYNWGPTVIEPSPQLLPLASYFDSLTK